MGAVASIPEDCSPRMQVIGAGLSRTGTKSMQLALETLLDGPVHHGGTQMFGREDSYIRLFLAAYRARERGDSAATLKHVRAITAGYVGITDVPGIDFIPEMLDLYPDAKVVLVTRDRERWWRSYKELAGNGDSIWLLKLMFAPIPGWRWLPYQKPYLLGPKEFVTVGEDGERRMVTASSTEGPEFAEKWTDYVRAIVPRERLLEMDVSEGWAPLCRFLGKEVPDMPFPRVNDAKALDGFGKQVMARVFRVWAGILFGLGLVAYGTWHILMVRRVLG